MTPMNDLSDKCRGSLIGGAVGDALGYEVEFDSLDAIIHRFGQRGITAYVTDADGVAVFSDDTQMSLFTAEGLLTAIAGGKHSRDEITQSITRAYMHWYLTQTRSEMTGDSWCLRLKPLWARRAPGITCLTALQSLSLPAGRVANNSKGCGGVMRVAPVGIFSAAHPDIITLEQAGEIAGAAAEITHKHPLSTLSSMALAMIVRQCILSKRVDRARLRSILEDDVFRLLDEKFSCDRHLADLHALVLKALSLVESSTPDFEAIRSLGEGWVAEETLAIALFSVMRYIDDFERCIVCSVNHSGDSDSTGAVAGNIIGAILGYRAIPEKYLTALELHDVIVSMADDLAGVSDETQMTDRYLHFNPRNVNPAYLI